MFVITVEFTVDPQARAAFLPLILENARRSLEDEPGCHQFDVCLDASRPEIVFLYERYDDRVAFDAHLASSHFKSFEYATRSMVTAKVAREMQRLRPETGPPR